MKSTSFDLPFQQALDSKDPLKKQQGYPRITNTLLIHLVGTSRSYKSVGHTIFVTNLVQTAKELIL